MARAARRQALARLQQNAAAKRVESVEAARKRTARLKVRMHYCHARHPSLIVYVRAAIG